MRTANVLLSLGELRADFRPWKLAIHFIPLVFLNGSPPRTSRIMPIHQVRGLVVLGDFIPILQGGRAT